jgi:integrase
MARRTTPKARQWPAVISHGNASVKLYKVTNKGRTSFTLAYKGGDGKRILRQFADEKEAREEAMATARKLHGGELAVLQLRDGDRHTYITALHALKDTGKRLDLAASEYAEACKILHGASLVEAVRFYRKHTGDVTRVTIEKAAAKFIEYIERKDRSPVYLKDIRYRMTLFTKVYGASEVHSLSHGDITRWLDRLKVSNRSRDNALRVLKTFLTFCQRQRFLPKGELPTSDIERFTDNEEGEIEIFTPKEMRALLDVAGVDVLPYLVLGAFAGIRTAEIKRLEWDDIDLVSGYITIQGRKAKTRQRRLIRIQPNLAAWLAILKRTEGVVSDLERPDKTVYEIYAKKAGVKWKRNGLRHSFISYRLAATNDENMVSSEAGNSPQMVYRNYRQLVKPEKAAEWFGLMPSVDLKNNIIPFAKEVA